MEDVPFFESARRDENVDRMEDVATQCCHSMLTEWLGHAIEGSVPALVRPQSDAIARRATWVRGGTSYREPHVGKSRQEWVDYRNAWNAGYWQLGCAGGLGTLA